MVQRKNEAETRQEGMRNYLQKLADQRRKETVGERWYVGEHTPAYNTGGYYDTDVPAKTVRVSAFFDTEKEAQDWADMHEADEGNELRICHDLLLEKTVRSWSSNGYKKV